MDNFARVKAFAVVADIGEGNGKWELCSTFPPDVNTRCTLCTRDSPLVGPRYTTRVSLLYRGNPTNFESLIWKRNGQDIGEGRLAFHCPLFYRYTHCNRMKMPLSSQGRCLAPALPRSIPH